MMVGGESMITAPVVLQVFSLLLHTGKKPNVLWNNWVYIGYINSGHSCLNGEGGGVSYEIRGDGTLWNVESNHQQTYTQK